MKIYEFLRKMDIARFHRIDLICSFGRSYVEGAFFYLDNSKIVEPREDHFGDNLEFVVGDMYENKIRTSGFMIIKSRRQRQLVVNYNFVETNNRKFLLSRTREEKLTKFNDYSFLGQKLVEKLTSPETESVFDLNNFNTESSRVVEPFTFMLKQILQSANQSNQESELYGETIQLWKNYKSSKMIEYMAISKYISPIRISECPFMSIEIIRAYPKFKFDWNALTKNSAIPIRDILNNSDLPWVYPTLCERSDVSLDILHSKGVYPLHSRFSTVKVYNEFDILMSPRDPHVISTKTPDSSNYISSDDLIESVINNLTCRFPEYFVDIPEDLLKRVRFQVKTNLENNCGEFDIDDFDFPAFSETKNEEIHQFESSFDILPEEIDPLGLRFAIAEINRNGLFKREAIMFYEQRIGIKIEYIDNLLIKNRCEFLKFLETAKSKHYIEKCIFFELEDAKNHKDAFFCRYKDIDNTGVMISSKKVTIDFFLKSNLVWFLDDLVEHLPFEFVFENLLFYPNRLKFNNISENSFIIPSETDVIRTELVNQDKNAMKIFCAREDFNYEYYTQFRNIDWDFTLSKCNEKNPFSSYPKYTGLCIREDISSMLKGIQYSIKDIEFDTDKEPTYPANAILENMSWNDLKTRQGIEILARNSFFGKLDTRDLTSISGEVVYNLLKTVVPYKIPAHFTSPSVIVEIPRVKWDLDICLDLVDLFEYYKANKSNFLFVNLYIYIVSIFAIPKDDPLKFCSAIHYMIKQRKFNDTDERIKFYEEFVEFLPVVNAILEKMGIHAYYINENLKSFAYCFPVEIVGKSKYSNIFVIVDAMNIND